MSQQGLRQASVRGSTGTTLDYNGDWSALFDATFIAAGDWNGRMLQWLEARLTPVTPFVNLNQALAAWAVAEGATNAGAIGTFTP